MAELTDFELMRQIQSRDRQAWVTLEDRYHRRLFEIGFAILKHPRKAERVAHQALQFCWRQAKVFDLERDRSLALWLYELAHFYAYQHLQRQPWSEADVKGSSPPRSAWTSWIMALLMLTLTGVGAYATWISFRFWQSQQQLALCPAYAGSELPQTYQDWLRQPDLERIALQDPSFPSTSFAEIFWSPVNQQLLLLAVGLPPAPPGQAYQLWAISTPDPNPALPEGDPSQLQASAQAPDHAQASDLSQPRSITESVSILSMTAPGTIEWLSDPLTLPDPNQFIITLEPEAGNTRPSGEVLLESYSRSE